MSEQLLLKWNAAKDRLDAAKAAIDEFQQLVAELQAQQAHHLEETVHVAPVGFSGSDVLE
ncbi:MAG: hypothetical protein WC941_06055 [Candidatus Bathyarchaeia archaeon]